MTSTVCYFTISNSDDKLTQAGWSAFVADVRAAVDLAVRAGGQLEFAGFSAPDAPWQNALWCVRLPNAGTREVLRARLERLCETYVQDSIAWAQVDQVEFLTPPGARSGGEPVTDLTDWAAQQTGRAL